MTVSTGYPDIPALAAEARELADRLRPNLVRPSHDLGRRVRAYRTALRNFRANRRLARQGREDLRPLYFIWTVHRPCNFLCEYCDDHQGKRYPELPTDGQLDTEEGIELLRIMRTGTPSVYFAGGEPLTRRDLPDLIDAAHRLAYYPIVVNTNGSPLDRLLKRPAWDRFLGQVDVMVVSLDALHLPTLSKMWGYARPEEVIRNLLLVRELAEEMGIKLMVNTVIQPGQVSHARDVLDLVGELGIWFCPVPVNVGPRVSGALIADPEYDALSETILRRKAEGQRITGSPRMLRRLLRSEPLDCRNTLKPHIDHDGRLFWPCKACVNVEPALVDVRDFEDVDALYAHASRLVDPTGFHGGGPDQCGADCNWAQNYTTDTYAHGLLHPRQLLADVAGFLRAA